MIVYNLFQGEDRSSKVRLNIFNSFFVKGLSVLSSFFLIPVSINYVDKGVYGLWLTISSIITWISLFDLGLTNGLRNNITEACAKEDYTLVRKYLSTTYGILLLYLLPVWILFFVFCNNINWQPFFNTQIDNNLLDAVVKWTFSAFCLQLLLQPLSAFLMAIHKHYLTALISFAGNLLAFILIICFGNYFYSSLLFLAIALSIPPVICMFVFSVFLFTGKYSDFAPGFKLIRFEYRRKLFRLGLKFFLIQIAGLIIFSSNNFIISQIEGNESVTVYNIVFRFFSVITFFQYLFLAPLWTGYTDAYTLSDYDWIRKAINKVNLLNWGLCFVLVVMLLLSNQIYKIWISESFVTPFSLNVLMAISVGISLFATNFIIFINGTGKIGLQTYISVLVIILHIPLAYFLMQILGMGINALAALNILWMSLSVLLWSIQYRKILSNSPSHFWNS
jgi:O-antigen/teichoic acid export membrane protein